MILWLSENLPTVIVCIILAAIITLVIIKMIKDRKKGKSSCGMNCSNCSLNSQCAKK